MTIGVFRADDRAIAREGLELIPNAESQVMAHAEEGHGAVAGVTSLCGIAKRRRFRPS